ncbi:MAG: FimV/HubP family polar landmark protein [Gammaproteobacteria bacterium]
MRKLTKTIALVSLMAPASVLSLGIGDIKLHSALNQNLNAEIALQVSANENPFDIKVKLAPPDKFDEAGVPWSYFLSKIKFDLVTRPDGSAFIKVTSNEALREPFLDFLLEVTWPKGNLYREFTVLVDPPATYQQPVIPVPTTGVTEAARDYARVVEKPVASVTAGTRQVVSEYGPVSRRDTLWTIAEKVNPYRDVSVEQVMIALYEANPKAFFKDNVNALKAGVKLKVPEKDVILKLSRKQALAEFSRQTQVWNGQLSAKAEPETAEKEEIIESQLKLLPPTQSEVAEDESVVAGEQESTAPDSASPESESGVVEEGVQPANADMQARLAKLEEQLTTMQQMLALKDEQLAALQHKQQGAEVKLPSPPAGTTASQTPSVAEPQTTVRAEPETDSDSGWYYWFVSLLGLGALGGIGWLWWRKRQIEHEAETDSMFAASSEISLPSSPIQSNVPAVEENAAYDVGTVGESSFLSEFTPSDFDAFDSDQHEVDPISEADVYLAYGRYQQAEELIRHAIDESPEKDDYKLKLLEIFYANENKESFEQYAEELLQAGKKDDAAFWEKVVEMGSEISPGAALFSMESGAQSADDNRSESSPNKASTMPSGDEDSDDDDLNFDLSLFEEPELDQSEAKKPQQPLDNSLDFDLSSFGSDHDDAASGETNKTEDSIKHGNDIEFDLTASDQANVPEQQKPGSEEHSEEDIESFDFDFSMPESDESDLSLNKVTPSDDFNLSIENTDTESAHEDILKDAEPDFDFNFDLDVEESDSEKGKSGALSGGLNLGVSDLTDMDEFETKIDLARAYIDMGDSEAAKDIAEEVLEKGNVEQKEAAQAILDELR